MEDLPKDGLPEAQTRPTPADANASDDVQEQRKEQIREVGLPSPKASTDGDGIANQAPRDTGNRPATKVEINFADWLMVLVTLVLVLVTAINAYVVYGQLDVMKGQLAEMRSAGADTKNLVRATLLSQRPWAGWERIQASELVAGKPLAISVVVTNSGQGPALALHGYYIALIEDAVKAMPPPQPECLSCSTAVLLPHASRSYKLEVAANLLTHSQIDRLKRRKDTIILVGRLDYLDATGSRHHAFSCAYYDAVVKAFLSCNEPDEVD